MSSVGVQLQTADNENAYPRPYFRIGDILESTNPNNPADDGYIGTWELYGKGRVTVCIDTDDNNFNDVNKEIGESTHTLTVNEIPSLNCKFDYTMDTGTNGYETLSATKVWSSSLKEGATKSVGGDEAHNNIQKSIVVYRWRRIA